MTIDQNKVIVRNFFEELDKHLGAIEEYCTPRCLAYLPGNQEPTDREGFTHFVTSLYRAFPDLHHKIKEQIAENDEVVSLVTVRGTHLGDFQSIAATGRKVVFADIVITRFGGGKVVELWAQFDAIGLLRQLGVYQS